MVSLLHWVTVQHQVSTPVVVFISKRQVHAKVIIEISRQENVISKRSRKSRH